MKASDISNPFDGFSKLDRKIRSDKLRELCSLTNEDLKILQGDEGLKLDQADHFIENVVGVFSLPLGVATSFLIDGRSVTIPMVVEETSVVAAASAAAKWVRRNGGFTTRTIGRLIIGQVQFPVVQNANKFLRIIDENQTELLNAANAIVPNLVARGGGVTGFQLRVLDRPDGYKMAVLHVHCDPCDAMGANLINQICEGLKPLLENLTGEKVGLCILSNLVDTKLVEATCTIKDIDPELGKAIEEATLFAQLDPYRAATHIKGIMNGIDPILIATGNDWRAVEAGVHTYASLPGSNRSLTRWQYQDGVLHGSILIPLALGTVGGITKLHPTVQVALKILKITKSEQLARICAAAGLAQNLAALKALCTEGIIRGHMRLHAANFALMAGATRAEFPLVEAALKKETSITLSRAQEILALLRSGSGSTITA